MELLNQDKSDEAAVLESAASVEVQQQAEAEGWIPPARFKGDAARFIDAEDFIERGKVVLPIVKKQLETTRGELAAMRVVSSETSRALKAAQEAIAAMELRHSVDTQKKVEQARKDLVAELAVASEAGDHKGVAEITDQLTQMAQVEEAPPPKKEVKEAPVYTPDPELVEWQEVNPWFGVNKRKTALFLACAQELKDGGETAKGSTLFNKAKAEMEKELGGGTPPASRVEQGRSGGETTTRSSSKGYNSLPADAKNQCRADAKQFVGPDKLYKTEAAWNAAYAELYFQGE